MHLRIPLVANGSLGDSLEIGIDNCGKDNGCGAGGITDCSLEASVERIAKDQILKFNESDHAFINLNISEQYASATKT